MIVLSIVYIVVVLASAYLLGYTLIPPYKGGA